MQSVQEYFESFIGAFPEADAERVRQLEVAFHAGVMATCTILSNTDSSEHAKIIRELQQEEHAFGKKEL